MKTGYGSYGHHFKDVKSRKNASSNRESSIVLAVIAILICVVITVTEDSHENDLAFRRMVVLNHHSVYEHVGLSFCICGFLVLFYFSS